MNPFRIQLLGRWHSPLVVHYAGESLATGLAQEMNQSAGNALPAHPSPELSDIRNFLGRLENRLAAIEAAERITPGPEPEPMPQPPAFPADSYVLNRESHAYHRTPVSAAAPGPEQRTVCGWRFGTPRCGLRASRTWYLRLHEIPAGTCYTKICRCKTERALAKASLESEAE